jgi:adenylate kinase family enzyme
MRVSVIGTSGSGKTTLGRRIASAFDLPFIEIDAINWQPGWKSLDQDDPEEFGRRIQAALSGERWVIDANYGRVLAPHRQRATHLVWLDYDRPVIMARVIRRSIARTLSTKELWAGTGNRERWTRWIRPSHPIRWAWSTWEKRRRQYEAMIAEPQMAHVTVLRLRRPKDAEGVVDRIRKTWRGESTSER